MIERQQPIHDGHDWTVVAEFRLPVECGAEHVELVGDFNGWRPGVHRMLRGDERFAIRVRLHAGRSYRFRYLLDGERWENDWAADRYEQNEFGGYDSVIDLSTAVDDAVDHSGDAAEAVAATEVTSDGPASTEPTSTGRTTDDAPAARQTASNAVDRARAAIAAWARSAGAAAS